MFDKKYNKIATIRQKGAEYIVHRQASIRLTKVQAKKLEDKDYADKLLDVIHNDTTLAREDREKLVWKIDDYDEDDFTHDRRTFVYTYILVRGKLEDTYA